MKKRKPIPIFRCLTVMLVGYFFANFFYFIAGALNFWPAYILALIIIVLCVNAVHSIITEWRGERTNTGAPSSALPETNSKIIIRHAWLEHLGVWVYWTEKTPRALATDKVPGRALAMILQKLDLENPDQYELVEAQAVHFEVKAG